MSSEQDLVYSNKSVAGQAVVSSGSRSSRSHTVLHKVSDESIAVVTLMNSMLPVSAACSTPTSAVRASLKSLQLRFKAGDEVPSEYFTTYPEAQDCRAVGRICPWVNDERHLPSAWLQTEDGFTSITHFVPRRHLARKLQPE